MVAVLLDVEKGLSSAPQILEASGFGKWLMAVR